MFVKAKKMEEAASTREYTYKYLQLLVASICKYLTRESEYSWEKIPASPSMGFRPSNTRESESELLGLALVDSLSGEDSGGGLSGLEVGMSVSGTVGKVSRGRGAG